MTGIVELAEAFRDGRTDPVAYTELCLSRVAAIDSELGAFVHVDEARARQDAVQARDELRSGLDRGLLHGVPIAVKELFTVRGGPANHGSAVRLGIVAERDALVVTRLRASGAVVLGLTRSHEFGWGITTQHALLGGTRNPFRADRIAGGSSGGSAAAVAAGLIPAAIATDTGGSVRIPSAFCETVGIKPSFGRVPRSGCVPLAPSFDTVGVIAGSVTDLWPVLAAVEGVDDSDPATVIANLAPLPSRSDRDTVGRTALVFLVAGG